jgi:hypothetical protein
MGLGSDAATDSQQLTQAREVAIVDFALTLQWYYL